MTSPDDSSDSTDSLRSDSPATIYGYSSGFQSNDDTQYESFVFLLLNVGRAAISGFVGFLLGTLLAGANCAAQTFVATTHTSGVSASGASALQSGTGFATCMATTIFSVKIFVFALLTAALSYLFLKFL